MLGGGDYIIWLSPCGRQCPPSLPGPESSIRIVEVQDPVTMAFGDKVRSYVNQNPISRRPEKPGDDGIRNDIESDGTIISKNLCATLTTQLGSPETLQRQLTQEKRQIGTFSAFFLIFNRMVGTGIFATPSTIFLLCGSVGLSLFIWVIGMIIAAAGMAVYLEFGTAIPRNGGEKNYLEFVYRHPKYLATGFYTGYVILLGWAGSNSVVFGEYILHAARTEVTRFNQRGIGLACITTAFLIHGTALKWGLRLQNLLGVIKLVVVLLIVVSGWVRELLEIQIYAMLFFLDKMEVNNVFDHRPHWEEL